MKKTLLLLLCLLWKLGLQAQNIQNIQITPSAPGPTDSVKIIADLVFTSGSCDLLYANHMQSNDTIYVNAFHCPGALTVICNTTDSINLGPFANGNYIIHFVVHTSNWSSPDPCTDINPTDSANLQLSVLTSIGNELSFELYPVKYQARSKSLIIEIEKGNNAQFLLLNSLGKCVLSKEIIPSDLINVSQFAEGIYFYLIRMKYGKIIRGKFLLH